MTQAGLVARRARRNLIHRPFDPKYNKNPPLSIQKRNKKSFPRRFPNLEVKNEYDLELLDINGLVDLDALVIAVGHDHYKALASGDLLRFMRDKKKCVLGDLKSIFNKKELVEAGFEVFRL